MKKIIIIVFFTIFVYSYGQKKIWSFNDCLIYAKENNLQVVASKLNEQIQSKEYNIAKKQKLPDINGTIDNSFSLGPILSQNINSSGFLDNNYKYTMGYQNNLALNSSIILYNNGNLKINEIKNNLLHQQYQLITKKIQNDISLQLVGNFLTVLLNKELSKVNKNSLNTSEQQNERNEKLYDAGSIPLSTLYESRANLADAKKQYETSIIDVNRSLMVLAMLLQKDYRDFDIETVSIPNNIELPLLDLDNIINYAFNSLPQIQSAQLGVKIAEKNTQLTKTALAPVISGGYKVNTFYNDYFDRVNKSLEDQWYDNHSQMLSIGIQIPIFNKGINKIKIQQSKIQEQIQQNQLDQEKLTLKQAIQTAYFDVNSSYQTFLSTKELVNSTKLSYEFAEKSFTGGKISVYDLNIARNNYFNAQAQMLQAKYSFLFRIKVLDFYMGKPLEI